MTAFLRYHGGKVRLAPQIIGLFPPHDCYVEPFGGGAAVLLHKDRTRLEVYNDLDGDMVAGPLEITPPIASLVRPRTST